MAAQPERRLAPGESSERLREFKAGFFKALSHPVRIRILELLRDGERSVSELQAALEIEPSATSQQLAVLRNRNLVSGRKQGTAVLYSIRYPEVLGLLDLARDVFNAQLVDTQALLDELAAQESPPAT